MIQFKRFANILTRCNKKNDRRNSGDTLRQKVNLVDFWTVDFQHLTFDQWTNGPMDQWTNGPMDQWTNGPVDQWTNGSIDQWTNGPMDQWFNRPMDQWTN